MMIGRFMINFDKYYNCITNALYRFDPHNLYRAFFIFPHHSHMFGLVAYKVHTSYRPLQSLPPSRNLKRPVFTGITILPRPHLFTGAVLTRPVPALYNGIVIITK